MLDLSWLGSYKEAHFVRLGPSFYASPTRKNKVSGVH